MEIANGQYRIQNIPIEDIVNEFGTPVYIYDADKIAHQFTTLKSAFSDANIRIKYAAKALTNPAILKVLKNLGSGMDAVSINEARLGLQAGFEASDILFTPNCVDFDEISEGIELGLTINIDNIAILEHFGNKYHSTVPIVIRLNPHIMAGGNNKISTGHVDSKFGISIYQLPHIMKIIKTYDLNVVGLHMHTGSDILDAEVFLQMAEILFSIASDFKDLEFIDFGSGFKVGYKEGDVTTNVFDLGIKLSKAFRDFCKDYGRELEMWFEPGKFLVSEAGILVTKTNVVKITPATAFVGVNSGLNHFVRPMMYDAFHDIINISNPNGVQRVYTIVGYICETDTFGSDRKLNEVREGDLIVMKNAGAYAFAMSSNYNSRTRPPEVLIYEGKAHLIRRREELDDITRTLVDFEPNSEGNT